MQLNHRGRVNLYPPGGCTLVCGGEPSYSQKTKMAWTIADKLGWQPSRSPLRLLIFVQVLPWSWPMNVTVVRHAGQSGSWKKSVLNLKMKWWYKAPDFKANDFNGHPFYFSVHVMGREAIFHWCYSSTSLPFSTTHAKGISSINLSDNTIWGS